jgi:hypothetical protein
MLLKEKDGIKKKDLMLKSFPPLKHIVKGICYIATIYVIIQYIHDHE